MKNHGYILRGTILGYKLNSFTNKETGEIRNSYVLGIGVSELNEFGSTSEVVEKVTVRENDFNNELSNKINQLKGKDVEIHVSFNAWEMNGRLGKSIIYVPQYGISEVK